METLRTDRRVTRRTRPNRPLTELRDEIDRVDHELVTALATRFRLASEAGALKRDTGLLPLDPRREAEIVRKVADAARAQGIPEEGVRQLFWSVIDYCREGARCG